MGKKWHYIQRLLARFRRAESGMAATEYAVLLSLIIIGSMGIIEFIGSRFAVLYTIIGEALPDGFG